MTEAFRTILEMTLPVSALVTLLLLLRPLLDRHVAAKWRVAVWMALALRLVILWNPDVSRPIEVALPTGIPTAATGEAFSPPATAPLSKAASGVSLKDTPAQAARARTATLPWSPLEIAAAVWGLGVCAVLLLRVSAYRRFLRDIRRWERPAQEQTARLFARAAAGTRVRLQICPKVPGPMLTGLFRPTVLLPHDGYSPRDLSLLLRHELAHRHRRDLWLKALLLAVEALHWFNPLVRLLVSRANWEIELACDDTVLRGSGGADREAYAETLMTLARASNGRAPALSTYFSNGTKLLRRRFENIFDSRRKRFGGAALLLALPVILSAGMLVSCAASQKPEAMPPSAGTPPTSPEPELASTPEEKSGRITTTLRDGYSVMKINTMPIRPAAKLSQYHVYPVRYKVEEVLSAANLVFAERIPIIDSAIQTYASEEGEWYSITASLETEEYHATIRPDFISICNTRYVYPTGGIWEASGGDQAEGCALTKDGAMALTRKMLDAMGADFPAASAAAHDPSPQAGMLAGDGVTVSGEGFYAINHFYTLDGLPVLDVPKTVWRPMPYEDASQQSRHAPETFAGMNFIVTDDGIQDAVGRIYRFERFDGAEKLLTAQEAVEKLRESFDSSIGPNLLRYGPNDPDSYQWTVPDVSLSYVYTASQSADVLRAGGYDVIPMWRFRIEQVTDLHSAPIRVAYVNAVTGEIIF